MSNIELKARFVDLAGRLSPENLSCDGELSRGQVKARYAAIMKEWKALEKEAGRTVTEDETWGWWDEITAYRRNEEARIIAAAPSNPLVVSNTPGVYKRIGASGQSAYYIQSPLLHLTTGFNLYSEFAYMLGDKERIGSFTSLEDAVSAGERFLLTIDREVFRTKRPNWSLAIVDRELERLPKEYRKRDLATICADAEMNKSIRA